MSIEEYLKEIIRQKGFTIKSFSEYIEIPYSTLRDILSRDIRKTSIENYLKICTGISVDAEKLMSAFDRSAEDNQFLSDLVANEDYKQRLDEASYKEKLIDMLHNLGYIFDEDAFDFGEYIVDELKVINIESNVHYEVNPGELYGEMKHTLKRIQTLQNESLYNIESSEIRKTLEKLDAGVQLINENQSEYIPFQYIEKVSAGGGYLYGDNEVSTCYTDRTTFKSYDFATKVKGDSMEPTFYDGDIILVKLGYDNVNGDIYVIDYDHESYVKKLHNDGDRFRLVSENDKYPVRYIPVPVDDGTYFNIVGKVVDSFTPVDI